MDSSPIYGIILFLIFIFINIMMYGFGSAVKNINESEIQKKADEGSKKALKLLKIIDNPHRFINTIQLTATCIAVITGGYQSIFFIRRINKVLLSSFGNQINHMILFGISVVAIILIMLIILLCLGVMVPKKLGLKYSNGFAFTFINAISAIMTILFPFTAIIEGLANLILKLFRIDPNEELENVTEEEIISMVNEGHEQGVLEEREVQMISNIMELDDKDAGDIMTHRKSIVAVDGDVTLEQAVNFMLDANNSRFPVFIDDIDNIIGIIHIRDAVERLHKEDKSNWLVKDIKDILRKPVFIPKTKNIDSLFKEMQSEKIHMEIVVDEYGQTAGIVAMEDILEEIVGNILDEYDEDDNNIVKQSDNVYLIKGMTPLLQIEEELSIIYDEEDYDTINGYLIAKLDRIPSDDERFVVDDGKYKYEVLAVENKMISLVKLTINEEYQENNELNED